ncbi:hypothetical protein FD13_GL001120 [Levilactobacillus senmaizukei DSM 21775 = NBRC 103853]|uniref:Uncharacterized protein n=1 Tax=Levilactobacillus senmaizukei DSM 21775 = NBRC 103853 TaxID=1423803 RepID=A0A0R2DNI2_9LACO|nr:DUF1361 domain-containing protein [Levilactobacillus senmaizukei]KRN01316.1 hypothetical protein FD13_GL001120 [Levilactobacillus senmaizukei DSM 21775 = NBRC 103853]
MSRRARWEVRIFFIIWLIFLFFRAKDPFSFLVLNTCLGVLPIEISFHLHSRQVQKAWLFWPIFALWLLFYPNTPYLLTDLFHLSLLRPYALSGLLRVTPHIWIYFTYMVISAVGCSFLGFWSLNHVSHLVAERLVKGQRLGRVAILVALTFLTSVGIYIGRFLRIHTIYLFLNPEQFVRPLITMWTPDMWLFVGLMTFIQLFCYWILHLITSNKDEMTL